MTETQSGLPDDAHFVALIADLVTQTWVALGKIKHPVTDKLERNIAAAGTIIDMLDMLNRKTTGNRSREEDRLLLESIQQLKLNYIAEKDKPDEPQEETASVQAPVEQGGNGDDKDDKIQPARRKTTSRKKSSPTKRKRKPKPKSGAKRDA